jgi:hypothetical protein
MFKLDDDWIELTFEAFNKVGYVVIGDKDTDIFKDSFANYLIKNNIDYDVEFEIEYVKFIKI